LKVFAFGGNNGDLDLKEVEVLDHATEQWSSLAPMKIARNGAQSIYFEKAAKIFVFGGLSVEKGALSVIERYDIV